MLISTALNAQQSRGLGFDTAQPPSGAETHTTVNLFLEIAFSIGERAIESKLHEKTGSIDLAQQDYDRALASMSRPNYL